jgi:hypothetical protein
MSRNSIDAGIPIDPELDALPPIQGYRLLYAQGFYNMYNYACTDSAVPGDTCLIQGSPEEVAERCDTDKECWGFVYYPNGRSDIGPNIGVLKGGERIDITTAITNLNQHASAYIKGDFANANDSGRLSPGAVAGIAIGCAIAGAVLAALGMYLVPSVVKRRRGQRQKRISKTASVSGEPSVRAPDANALQLSNAVTVTRQWAPSSPFLGGTASVAPGPSVNTDNTIKPPSNGTDTLSSDKQPPAARSANELLDEEFYEFSWQDEGTAPYGNESSRGVASTAPALPATYGDASYLANSLTTRERVLEALREGSWEQYSVKFEDIEWLRGPHGHLMLLGSGAFSKVYLVRLSGIHTYAAKVIGLHDARSETTFLRVRCQLKGSLMCGVKAALESAECCSCSWALESSQSLQKGVLACLKCFVKML